MQLRLTQDEFKKLVQDTIEAKYALDSYSYDDPVRAVANLPASDAELIELEATLRERGVRMPPSYRQFLTIHNGILHFLDDEDLALLSAQEVVKATHSVREKDFPGLSKFVIGAGNTPEFISFDTTTQGDDGEMEVVHVAGDGDQSRSEDLVQFFRQHYTYITDNLRLERKDRAELEND
jgi:hypothetical protein